MNREQKRIVRARLDNFLKDNLKLLGRSERRKWGAEYIKGLLSTAERKTVFAIASRSLENNSQAIQQMLQSSPWDGKAVLTKAAFNAITELESVQATIVDDTGFLKKGRHSVGVARQYTGVMGSTVNCQVAVSLHWASSEASFPFNWALYLPREWTDDPARCRKAGVPENIVFRKKWELALDMLDEAREKQIPLGVIVADHSYGVCTEFREGLVSRQLTYSVEIDKTLVFWRHQVKKHRVPSRKKGCPTKLVYPTDDPPETAEQIALSLPAEAWSEIVYGKGSKKPLQAKFAALRVQPAFKHHQQGPELDIVWLLIQQTPEEKSPFKYFLCNMTESTPLVKMVKITKLRWRIEMDYQNLKGEVGLDHYEGRSWRGWNHHVTLSTLSYMFLMILQREGAFFPSEDSDYQTNDSVGAAG